MRPSLILKFTISDIPVHDSNSLLTLGTLALAQTRLPDGGQAWQNLTQQR